jgi:phosphate-selective porin OprO/OprP
VVTLAVLGYDAAEELGVASALLRGTYVHQNPDLNNTFTRQLRHVASVNFEVEDGWWGLRSDITTARGYLGQSDLWGATIMPFLNVVAGLQFVGRYTYLSSEGANGVRLPRYENKLVDGRGDRYDELYLGVNYYFYGHKLKLQGGVNFANMEDRANDGGGYSGVAATTGLRVSW